LNLISTGLSSLNTIEDRVNIKALFAKLQLDNKMVLENDIVIDFTTWNHNSQLIGKIKGIRQAIATKALIEIGYFGGAGYSQRAVEPYKLIFKQESWYLSGYCKKSESFRVFKLSRIVEMVLTDSYFERRLDYEIPELKDDFVNSNGEAVTVRMDHSLEFLAIDFFGAENMHKDGRGNIIATFEAKNVEWVLGVLTQFGDKAEIISPSRMRERMKNFLERAVAQYKT